MLGGKCYNIRAIGNDVKANKKGVHYGKKNRNRLRNDKSIDLCR